MTFAKLLRVEMDEHGFSGRSLADHTGVAPATIFRFLTGEMEPRLVIFRRLAGALPGLVKILYMPEEAAPARATSRKRSASNGPRRKLPSKR
jgi:transcriptional regulator with XRE-family HTH domain